ncbi:MAG: hypothetical protein HYR84_13645 [Planctomycetes bacterium]|nr:hypothetical protein [Planctomycetota bacterium]
MPLVFRVMKRDADGLPTVAPSASALGVRPSVDIDVDNQGNAVVNFKGMSVSPSWRDISIFRIPKRLGGQGSNNTFCFKMGTGAFQQGLLSPGLELFPDSPTHGVVRPEKSVALQKYESDLAATRGAWLIDEA